MSLCVLHLNRIRRKTARVKEKITEVGRPFSVRLRTRPEAAGEGQSGLMLRALSCYGNDRLTGQRGTLSVNLVVRRTESETIISEGRVEIGNSH